MHSPVPAKPCDDPCDVVAVAPDAVRVAPSDEELSDVLHQAARARSDTKTACSSGSPEGRTAPPVDTAFRAASVDDVLGSGGRSIIGRAGRGLIALLLATCIGLAAVAWKSYGDTAKKKIAKLATQFVVTSALPSEEVAPATAPGVPAVAAAEPASLVQTAPKPIATAAEPPSPETAQLLQSMARRSLGANARGRAIEGRNGAAQGWPATAARGWPIFGAETAGQDSGTGAGGGQYEVAQAVICRCATRCSAGL